jgi:ribosomal protein L11 methyltransferase
MADLSQWTLRFVDYEPVDEALDDRMRRIASDSDKIPEEAMHLDVESGVLTIDCKKVPAWNDGGTSRLRTVRVGKTFVVRPPWISDALAEHERLIVIDPAGAFGSALHETTQLCLQSIESHMTSGLRVLEVGTGSGVLSIAAALCGAAAVLAVDVDPIAVESARGNVMRNGVQAVVQVSLSEGPPWLPGQVDVFIANITYDTLSNLRDSLAAALRPGGLLIASGVSPRFWKDFVLAIASCGFEPIEQLNRPPWSALVARRRTA